MIQYEQIIPECYVDTNLIGALLGGNVNHGLGCTGVTNIMINKKKNQFAVGIIDYDKVTPTYLSEFNRLSCRTLPRYKATDNDVCIYLYQHKIRPHYLIVIEKAIERLIIRCAALSGVKMEDYHLPGSLEGLKAVTKHKASNKDYMLQQLFNALLESGNSDLLALRETLRYLVTVQQNADAQELKRIFNQ